ncbi:MAG: META domain-containing protein [Treponema sp.]|jgi:heat shock protein HslJ|nr:META domain-containing protein [Treponema sp.]
MKKLFFTFALIAAFVLGCKSTNNLTDISDAIGKDWKLVEVRVNNRNTEFNRKTLVRDGFGEIFTIKIDTENISGVGAPNRYSAPYTSSAEDITSVKIETVRSTLMAPIYHPERLREHEFFVYIQNTYKWGLSDGKLELHSKNDSGTDVVMVFSL